MALRLCFFCGPFLLFVFRVCLVFLSVHCSLVGNWPLGSFVCDVLLCFCYFPMWCPGSGLLLDCIDSWYLPSFFYTDIPINVFYIKWIWSKWDAKNCHCIKYHLFTSDLVDNPIKSVIEIYVLFVKIDPGHMNIQWPFTQSSWIFVKCAL